MQVQPLVERVANRLPTCKAHILDMAGRTTLVQSVLTSIPIHQLLALTPQKKVIKQCDKIRSGFIWAGQKKTKGGHCLVNWSRVCRPIGLGTLGILDLDRMGMKLSLR